MESKRTPGLIILVGLLSACASPRELPPAPDLGADAKEFGPARTVIPAENLLAVDDDMRAYVATIVTRYRSPKRRLQAIMDGLFRPGEYTIDYEADLSLTASETFRRRRGNCLSTTALFVALAREAGLSAQFQDFDRRPVLRLDEGIWIHEKHVNAVVEFRRQRLEVDFDRRAPLIGHGRLVHDGVAVAQFFSNLGVRAMRDDDLALAHARFREAVVHAPELAYVWNNVGVLYRRAGLESRAEAIFRHALALNPGELRAMSNLAGLYRERGRLAEAEDLGSRLEHARRRNPYYHYALAERAFRKDALEDAERHIRRAIDLEENESMFHDLKRQIDTRRRVMSERSGEGD